MSKVIAIKAYNRPDYFGIMIKALSECIGIFDYKIFISLDKSSKDTQDQMLTQLASSGLTNNTIVYTHQDVQGCAGNTRFIFDKAFEDVNTDFIIHLEDDTIPSTDFLLYMEWARATYLHDNEVFSIAGYNNSKRHNDLVAVKTRGYFTCWGFGLFRRIFDEINENLGVIGTQLGHAQIVSGKLPESEFNDHARV